MFSCEVLIIILLQGMVILVNGQIFTKEPGLIHASINDNVSFVWHLKARYQNYLSAHFGIVGDQSVQNEAPLCLRPGSGLSGAFWDVEATPFCQSAIVGFTIHGVNLEHTTSNYSVDLFLPNNKKATGKQARLVLVDRTIKEIIVSTLSLDIKTLPERHTEHEFPTSAVGTVHTEGEGNHTTAVGEQGVITELALSTDPLVEPGPLDLPTTHQWLTYLALGLVVVMLVVVVPCGVSIKRNQRQRQTIRQSMMESKTRRNISDSDRSERYPTVDIRPEGTGGHGGHCTDFRCSEYDVMADQNSEYTYIGGVEPRMVPKEGRDFPLPPVPKMEQSKNPPEYLEIRESTFKDIPITDCSEKDQYLCTSGMDKACAETDVYLTVGTEERCVPISSVLSNYAPM